MRILTAATMLFLAATLHAETSGTGFGVDLDFYTGPVAHDVWFQMKQAGQQFAVVQAWGGRSRNEFAVSQLAGARLTGGMATAAYILLNYDDKVCRTFARPVRDRSGRCGGDPVLQLKRGGRWQVRQGIAALGSELAHVAFIAIDVEWFLSASPSIDAAALTRRRQNIVDAIDEVRNWKKKPVVYTRNAGRHWKDITGCDAASADVLCKTLSRLINDPQQPVPLWDVQTGDADLSNFQPYASWTARAGRQFKLDANLFGLPAGRTVDLNVFDASLFAPATSATQTAPAKPTTRRKSR